MFTATRYAEGVTIAESVAEPASSLLPSEQLEQHPEDCAQRRHEQHSDHRAADAVSHAATVGPGPAARYRKKWNGRGTAPSRLSGPTGRVGFPWVSPLAVIMMGRL